MCGFLWAPVQLYYSALSLVLHPRESCLRVFPFILMVGWVPQELWTHPLQVLACLWSLGLPTPMASLLLSLPCCIISHFSFNHIYSWATWSSFLTEQPRKDKEGYLMENKLQCSFLSVVQYFLKCGLCLLVGMQSVAKALWKELITVLQSLCFHLNKINEKIL